MDQPGVVSPVEGFQLTELLLAVDWPLLLRVALLLLLIPGLVFSGRWLQAFLARRHSQQTALLARKTLVYSGLVVVTITLLGQLGLEIGPLLGAIGLAGVAIGFASQTSLSNIISGLFLLADRPFRVGDLITVDGTTGFVVEIDLLSIKLRTFDNRLVRVPNELAIKAKLENITHHPIRRIDTDLLFAHESDVPTIRRVLAAVADELPLVLCEPEPVILFKQISERGFEFFLGCWVSSPDWLPTKNALMDRLVLRCREAGLRFAVPRRLVEQQVP
jgi:small-conductance mechanosensitive channel